MTNTEHNKCAKLIFISLFLVGPGCASQSEQYTTKIQQMEKELMQLKAQNTNLQSRSAQLDDKLMVYEKKSGQERQQLQRNRLKTVKLSPDGTHQNDMETQSQIISFKGASDGAPHSRTISFAAKSVSSVDNKQNADRPLLKLSDQSDYSNRLQSSSSGAPSSSGAQAVSRRYADIPPVNEGDNLGVVRNGTLLQPPDTEDDGSASASKNGVMELFHAAYQAYNNGNYSSALSGFAQFIKKDPLHDYADNAMYWRGECYLSMGKMMRAIGEFERLLVRYPRSDKAASSLYRLGYVYEQMSDTKKAEEYYFRVVDNFPGTDAARKASRRVATRGTNVSFRNSSEKR